MSLLMTELFYSTESEEFHTWTMKYILNVNIDIKQDVKGNYMPAERNDGRNIVSSSFHSNPLLNKLSWGSGLNA